jgi:hypothetical protein
MALDIFQVLIRLYPVSTPFLERIHIVPYGISVYRHTLRMNQEIGPELHNILPVLIRHLFLIERNQIQILLHKV